jgi:hypothetical protein
MQGSAEGPDDRTLVRQRLDALAEEYNATRASMPPGTARTSKMTSIVSHMISVLSGVGTDLFDVSEHLSSSDRGQRLAAYAYLYANPDARRTQEVVDALVNEDKPFGQYWALRALRKQLLTDPTALDLNSRRRLEQLAEAFAPTTDRAYELREALKEAPK